jgi:hypothetical protein
MSNDINPVTPLVSGAAVSNANPLPVSVAGGGSDSTAANQVLQIAQETAINTALGATTDAAVAAGAAGSLLAKLRSISRDLVANIVLAAGSAIIGKVGIDQTTPGTTNAVALISGQNGVAAGAGTSSATTQRVTVATDDGLHTKIGEVQASPTSNTILDRLKQLLTGIVLAAGSAIIGKVGIDQTTPGTTDSVSVKSQGYKSSVSITRTNDTNAYVANDVIGAATGSTAAITFASIGPSAGGEVMITSVEFEIDASAVISGETSYNLYLYNVTPPSAVGDNGAFDIPSGDRASFVGKIALGTPVDEGSTLYIRTDGVNAQVTVPSGGSLFGYLVTVGAYTPTASRVYKVTLHGVGL